MRHEFDIDELKKTCERMTAKTMGITPADESELTQDTIRMLDSYLWHFCASSKCPGCGWDLGGLLGSFSWGIQHGEGTCRQCGYPARGYHIIPDDDPDKEPVATFNGVLAYHPSVLVHAKPSTEGDE